VRLELDRELYRTEVIRWAASVPPLPANVIDVIADWRERWIAKGWTAPPIEAARAYGRVTEAAAGPVMPVRDLTKSSTSTLFDSG
jgi:hypothetical protein